MKLWTRSFTFIFYCRHLGMLFIQRWNFIWVSFEQGTVKESSLLDTKRWKHLPADYPSTGRLRAGSQHSWNKCWNKSRDLSFGEPLQVIVFNPKMISTFKWNSGSKILVRNESFSSPPPEIILKFPRIAKCFIRFVTQTKRLDLTLWSLLLVSSLNVFSWSRSCAAVMSTFFEVFATLLEGVRRFWNFLRFCVLSPISPMFIFAWFLIECTKILIRILTSIEVANPST